MTPFDPLTALEELATTTWPQDEKEHLRRGEKSPWLGRILQREACSKEDVFQIADPLLKEIKTREKALKVIHSLDPERFFLALQVPQENTLALRVGGSAFYIAQDISAYFAASKAFKEGKEGQITFGE